MQGKEGSSPMRLVERTNRTHALRPLLAFFMLVAAASAATTTPASGQSAADQLRTLTAGPQRSEKNQVRDPYRHPLEVLSFFGVSPDSTVVEILPGAGGYWTEILAPYLRDHGRYIAANGEEASPSAEVQKDNAGFRDKIAGDPINYGKVEVSQFAADRHE